MLPRRNLSFIYVGADTLLSEHDCHYVILFFQKYYYSVTMKLILYLKQ